MARLLLLFLLAIAGMASSKEPPPPPSGGDWVIDEPNLLSPAQERYLMDKIHSYRSETSTEIAVVIENSLEGEDLYTYSNRLADRWEIGSEGKDNGILIYLAYEGNVKGKRGVWIQVGKGLEGALPDITIHRIIRDVMLPQFKKDRFGSGINDAIDTIIRLADGEFVFDEEPGPRTPSIWIIIVVVIVMIILLSRGGGPGTTYGKRSSRGPIWVGGWGGGGTFGGGSFGGGFGGGSFGGGGAGGNW